ncbi:MAG: diguanylate cyclase domain-containing protein [Comamonas sp.]
MPAHDHHRPLRTYLVWIVLATLLPILAASCYVVWRTATSYRAYSQERLLNTAVNLGHGIELDVRNRDALLRLLATTIDVQDPVALRQALKVAGLADSATLEMLPAGDIPGQAASLLPAAFVQQLNTAPHSAVSQLYFVRGAPRLAMATALPTGGVLVLSTRPEDIVSTAPDSSDEGMLVAVTDGNGRILARSVQAERYIGAMAPDWERLRQVGNQRGTFEGKRADGGSVMFAFKQLPGTPGWVVVTGVPLESFNARWQQPLRTVVLAGLAAFVIALLVAAWLAQQILRPIHQLARSARAGQPFVRGDASRAWIQVREFESLRGSLDHARQQLEASLAAQRSIAQALASSEQRSRTLAHAGAAVLWTLDTQGRALSVVGWHAQVGRPDSAALGFAWLRRVHPHDVRMLRQQASELLAQHAVLDVELRLRAPNGQWRWMRARGAAINDARGRLQEWLGVLEDVDERKRAQAAVSYLAHHDSLTRLPNRSRLLSHLGSLTGNPGRRYSGALQYLDLDRFKPVNDTFGHAAGDALLCAVAQRLRGLLRATDLVARLGGDEFCIVQDAASLEAASRLAERVIEALSEPYTIEGREVTIGVSIGITLHLSSFAAVDPDRLLREADRALYAAKKLGRGRYVFYTPDLEA